MQTNAPSSQSHTWEDIERAALHDSVLHAAVTFVRNGTSTREEALIAAALALAKIRADQQEQLVQDLMTLACWAGRHEECHDRGNCRCDCHTKRALSEQP